MKGQWKKLCYRLKKEKAHFFPETRPTVVQEALCGFATALRHLAPTKQSHCKHCARILKDIPSYLRRKIKKNIKLIDSQIEYKRKKKENLLAELEELK